MSEFRKFLWFILGGFILAFVTVIMSMTPADALIRANNPVVGVLPERTSIERGAVFDIAILYENTAGGSRRITSTQIEINYDENVIDEDAIPPSLGRDWASEQGLNLGPGFGLDAVNNRVTYQRFTLTAGAGINVSLGASSAVNLVTFRFHIRKDAPLGPGTVLTFRPPDGTTLFVIASYSGGDASDGATPTQISALTIAESTDPTFLGLQDATPAAPGSSGILSGTPTSPDIGNTVSLLWQTNALASNDEGGGAETLYSNGDLSYRVYRHTSETPFLETPIGSEPIALSLSTTGDPAGTHRFQDGPANGGPAATNPLSDGTPYWYWVTAMDDTRPDPNILYVQTDDPTPANATRPERRTIIPYDLTPPPITPSFTAAALNNNVNLTWSNPTTPDFNGVVILYRIGVDPIPATPLEADPSLRRVPGAPHGPEFAAGGTPLAGVSDVIVLLNRTYAPGVIPATDSLEVDAVLGALPNGTSYRFMIYTYDLAVDGNPATGAPREQGRNYSVGVAASAIPGVPPNAITSFQAISSPTAGQIRLRWRNPAGEFGGVLILANTDDNPADDAPATPTAYWSPLPNVAAGALAISGPQQDFIFFNRAATGAAGDVDFVDIDVPDLSLTYYFRAYTYNITPGGLGTTGVLWGTANAGARITIQGNLASHQFATPTDQDAAIPGVAVGAGNLVYNLGILLPNRAPPNSDNIQLLWAATTGVTNFDIYTSTDLLTWTQVWDGSIPGPTAGAPVTITSIGTSSEPGFNFATAPFAVDTPVANPIMYFRVLPESEPGDGVPLGTQPREVVGKYTVQYERPAGVTASKPNIFTFSLPFRADGNPTTPAFDEMTPANLIAQMDVENPGVGGNPLPTGGRVDYVGFWNHATLTSVGFLDVTVGGIPNPVFDILPGRAYQVGVRSGGLVRWTVVGRLAP